MPKKGGQPAGMRPSEVAKQLGLSVQSVYKHIKEGTIKAAEVPFGDARTTYVRRSLSGSKEHPSDLGI